MADSRRPRPSRRPQQARRPAARRPTRPSGSGRPAPAARAQGLTTRAAILGLVLCAVVVSAAVPFREYLAQHAALARLTVQQGAQRERIAALEEQRRQLSDPAYVAALARQRLHFVRPGETAYILIVPSAAPTTNAPGAAAPAGPQAPWYSQLWGSVRTADRPVGVPRPHASAK